MLATDLADLTGLLATAVRVRVADGDNRPKDVIANDVLRETGFPDLGPVNERLVTMIAVAKAAR